MLQSLPISMCLWPHTQSLLLMLLFCWSDVYRVGVGVVGLWTSRRGIFWYTGRFPRGKELQCSLKMRLG